MLRFIIDIVIEMFREWFEWPYHSMILDLADEQLLHDLA